MSPAHFVKTDLISIDELDHAIVSCAARIDAATYELRMGDAASIETVKRLCCDSHAVVHEGGFRIETDFQDNWSFVRPDGIAVPATGYHSRDTMDEETGEFSGLYNKTPAGASLSVAENFVKEPPAPAYLH